MLQLAMAIGGELIFGLAMGMIVSFTFYCVQWAGELIGQQIGFNLGEALDPAYSGSGTLVGDLYFMLATVVFFAIDGHRILMTAVYESFQSQQLLSLTFNANLFDTFVDLFTTATVLAMRLAAPTFFTMLVVDLAMGCIGQSHAAVQRDVGRRFAAVDAGHRRPAHRPGADVRGDGRQF